MDNVIKLPSQQSLFNKTNRLVDLIIPGSSGVYDLSKTYVSINMNVSGVALDTTTGLDGRLPNTGGYVEAADAVANLRVALQHNATKTTIYDTCAIPVEALVTNCSMFSAARGKIEDIRRVDALRSTMKAYTQDIDDVQDRALGGLAGMAKTNPWASGRFAQLVGIGDTPSEYRPHEIRVYLKDLFNIGNAEAWDTSIYGDTRIHLELKLDRVKVLQTLGLSNQGNATETAWDRYYHNQVAAPSQPANVKYSTASTVTIPPTTTLSSSTMEMSAQYDSLEDSPFYVSQMVAVTTTYGGAGSAAGTKYPVAAEKRWGVIKSISWDKTTKRVTLDFGGEILQIGVITGVFTVDREVVGVDAVGITGDLATSTVLPVYDSIELTALIRSDVDAGPENIQYTQYLSQTDQWQNSSSLSRTYYLPPQTTNAVIIMPSRDNDGTAPTNFSDILGCARLNDYRFTLNGVSVTNRAVPFMPGVAGAALGGGIDDKCEAGSSLHYSLISETFLNMGQRFHSLSEAVYDQDIPMSTQRESGGGLTGWLSLQACPEKRVYMISLPVPISNDQQQLTIDLNGTFAQSSGELHIFSEIRSVV